MPVEERIRHMLEFLQLDLKPFAAEEWLDFLLELERLDDHWADRLQGLNAKGHDLGRWERPFEQLLVYLLCRHLPGALEDDDFCGRIAYVVFAWNLVRSICAAEEKLDFEGIVETCRLYSSELEYSDENIAAIIERLHKINPEL